MLNTYLIKFVTIDEYDIHHEGRFTVKDCPSEDFAMQLFRESWYEEDETEWMIESIEVISEASEQ